MAFEKQSQHIAGLLAELQVKESALLSQGEELQRYKQELDALKAEKQGEEKERRTEEIKEVEDGEEKEERQDERLVEITELQVSQEKECAVTILTANSLADVNSNAQKDAGQLEIVTSDAETPVSEESDNEAWSNQDSFRVIGETECGQDGGTADELLALRQEDQLLKQRIIEGLTGSAVHTDSENTGNAALSCSAEQRSPSVPNDISTDARQSLLQDVKRSEDEGGDLERVDEGSEEELDEASELQINRLQQQVATVYYCTSL